MPVHGEGVQRVALRPVPYPFPVGDQVGEHALLVQRFPHSDGGLPGAQQRDQGVPGAGRPGHGQRRALLEPGQGAWRERQAGLGCCRGGAQHEHRIGGGIRRPGQHDLTVLLHQPVGERPPRQASAAPATAQVAACPVAATERTATGSTGPGGTAPGSTGPGST